MINVSAMNSYLMRSPDLGIAKRFCNRLLVMNHGKIVDEGESSTIFSQTKNTYTKSLINSSLNLI